MMKTVEIFDVKIDCFSKESFKQRLKSVNHPVQVVKINTEFLLRAYKDQRFKEVLNGAGFRIADGVGVLWAAKYLSFPLTRLSMIRQLQAVWQMIYSGASLVFFPKYCRDPITETIPGLEAFSLMLESAIETEKSVYFLGAMEDVNEKTVKILHERYPQLKIAGNKGGFWKDGEEIEDINKSGAKILIVALGSPKQEYWINDNLDKLKTVEVAVGEGGTLDFVAGAYKRAPKAMRSLGLEWFWRLFMNKNKTLTGSRAKRVWNAFPVFVYNTVKYKIEKV